MRKKSFLVFLLLCAFLIGTIAGCGTKTTEIDKEDPSASSASSTPALTSASPTAKADTRDIDALYTYVKTQISDITRENFDAWDISYFDITGDGGDEAVIVGAFGEVWLDDMVIISGDSGSYKRIPADIPLAKYENIANFKDGFFTVMAKTGGTGELFTTLSIFVYNGTGMVSVLSDLNLEHSVSAPDTDYIETGVMSGPLNAFEYTLTKHDNLTGKDLIMRSEQYTYHEETMSFKTEPLAEPSPADTIKVGDMEVGAPFAGGTISFISLKTNEYGDADFNLVLSGEFDLEGTLSYSEFFGDIYFVADTAPYPTEIDLGESFGAYNPFGWPLAFRNMETLMSQLDDAMYQKMLQDTEYHIALTVSAKDLSFTCVIPGEAGGTLELIQVTDISY